MCICCVTSEKEFTCRCDQSHTSHKRDIPLRAQEFRTDLANRWHLGTVWVLTNLNPVDSLEVSLCWSLPEMITFYVRVDAVVFAPPS